MEIGEKISNFKLQISNYITPDKYCSELKARYERIPKQDEKNKNRGYQRLRKKRH